MESVGRSTVEEEEQVKQSALASLAFIDIDWILYVNIYIYKIKYIIYVYM